MVDKKEGKGLSNNPNVFGFLAAVFVAFIFPLWIFGGVSKTFIESAAVVAVAVIPLVTVLLSIAIGAKDRNCYAIKIFAGMNLGNAFVLLLMYATARMNNIELSGHYIDIPAYGFILSLLVAGLIHLYVKLSGAKRNCSS